jgi:serine/threonine-protein kinase
MPEELTKTVGARSADGDDRLEPGSVVGDYIVYDLIALGGCGAVYRAEHRVLGRQAAVKILHADLASSAEMLQRFLREARTVNVIKHPNIVDIYDFGELKDGRPYFVMEYLAGETLGELVDRHGCFSPAEALRLIEPICSALQAAHDAGVIHRDVKSNNVMVLGDWREGRLKLLDFGVAKLTQPETDNSGMTTSGRRLGTPSFMAPEQFSAVKIDSRVDVYALGVLLFQMLTNRLPFNSEDPIELERMHLESAPPAPSEWAPVSLRIDQVTTRCLAKKAEDRFPDVRSFVEALRSAVSEPAHPTKKAEVNWAHAIVIFVETRVDSEQQDPSRDELLDDLWQILDKAHHALIDAGFTIALETGTSLLGTTMLKGPSAPDPQRRLQALATAARLRGEIDGRPLAQASVGVCISVHSGRALVTSGIESQIVTGDVAQIATWTRGATTTGICCTQEIIEGLSEDDVSRYGLLTRIPR